MRLAIGFVLGVVAGLAFHHIPPALDRYAARGLPSEYTGPRYRTWQNGEETAASRFDRKEPPYAGPH